MCQLDLYTYFLCIINLPFKKLIDDIVIELESSRNFANMEDIKRKCNLMMNLSKFISNKKIFSEIVTLSYN